MTSVISSSAVNELMNTLNCRRKGVSANQPYISQAMEQNGSVFDTNSQLIHKRDFVRDVLMGYLRHGARTQVALVLSGREASDLGSVQTSKGDYLDAIRCLPMGTIGNQPQPTRLVWGTERLDRQCIND